MPANRTHGSGPAVPVDALLWDDPELALVHADPDVYTLAHPCECEALCQCGYSCVQVDGKCAR